MVFDLDLKSCDLILSILQLNAFLLKVFLQGLDLGLNNPLLLQYFRVLSLNLNQLNLLLTNFLVLLLKVSLKLVEQLD